MKNIITVLLGLICLILAIMLIKQNQYLSNIDTKYSDLISYIDSLSNKRVVIQRDTSIDVVKSLVYKNINETKNFNTYKGDTIILNINNYKDTVFDFAKETYDSCIEFSGQVVTPENIAFMTNLQFKNTYSESFYKIEKKFLGIRFKPIKYYKVTDQTCPDIQDSILIEFK